MTDSNATDELQRLDGGQNLVLGVTVGMLCMGINYPMLTWKNAVQQGMPLSFKPAVVYRGLPVAMLNLGGTTAIQFFSTGVFQKLLAPDGHLSDEKAMISSFLGGFFSGIPCSLYELTMIQQQRFGGSLVQTLSRLVKSHGAATLARGMTTTIGRESLYTMAMLGITPVIQRNLVESYGVESSVALGAGSIVGALISATISHPMDTIKTCMQGDCAREKYGTVMTTTRSLIQQHGIAGGLFKGLTMRCALIASTFFIVNELKGTVARFMFPSTLRIKSPSSNS